jgi:hypothetical protein
VTVDEFASHGALVFRSGAAHCGAILGPRNAVDEMLNLRTLLMATNQHAWGGYLARVDINRWLHQFEPEHRLFALRLLTNFRLYRDQRMSRYADLLLNTRLREMVLDDVEALGLDRSSNEAEAAYQDRLSRALICPMESTNRREGAQSGHFVAWLGRTSSGQPRVGRHFASLNSLRAFWNRNPAFASMIVFVDDFVGSGSQARKTWENRILDLRDLVARLADPLTFSVYYLSLAATEVGLTLLAQNTGLKTHAIDVFDDRHRVFSERCTVFRHEDRAAAKDVFTSYGERLEPGHPLGYSDGQLLVSFGLTTPNNTLPIFWKTRTAQGASWFPLFHRGG